MAMMGFAVATALSGCVQRADLTPVGAPNLSGPRSFCKIVKEGPDKGKLVVTVKNNGAVAASATTTRVEFIPGGLFSLPTPPIPAKGSVDLKVSIPGGCWKGGCYFIITVDSDHDVDADEENNSAAGHCPD
jgi:hypothetical protein